MSTPEDLQARLAEIRERHAAANRLRERFLGPDEPLDDMGFLLARLEEVEWGLARREALYAGVYDLLRAHDNYGTGGDASVCAREALTVLREKETALDAALAEVERLKAELAQAEEIAAGDEAIHRAEKFRLETERAAAFDKVAALGVELAQARQGERQWQTFHDDLQSKLTLQKKLRAVDREELAQAKAKLETYRTKAHDAMWDLDAWLDWVGEKEVALATIRSETRREVLAKIRSELIDTRSTYMTWSLVQLSDELHRMAGALAASPAPPRPGPGVVTRPTTVYRAPPAPEEKLKGEEAAKAMLKWIDLENCQECHEFREHGHVCAPPREPLYPGTIRAVYQRDTDRRSEPCRAHDVRSCLGCWPDLTAGNLPPREPQGEEGEEGES